MYLRCQYMELFHSEKFHDNYNKSETTWFVRSANTSVAESFDFLAFKFFCLFIPGLNGFSNNFFEKYSLS